MQRTAWLRLAPAGELGRREPGLVAGPAPVPDAAFCEVRYSRKSLFSSEGLVADTDRYCAVWQSVDAGGV